METNLKIGNKVRVKENTECPDLKYLDIGGWQGTITEILEEEDKILISIIWDDMTLGNMPQYFVEHGDRFDLDNKKMFLYDEDVELI